MSIEGGAPGPVEGARGPRVRPIPRPSELSRPFWEACRRHELTFLRCRACGLAFFPPEAMCTRCRSTYLSWEKSTGRGTVYSFSVVRSEPSVNFPIPTVFAIVDLEEGYSMFSDVVECDPAAVEIDMPVEVVFEELSDEISLPLFRPTS